jgi:hypothetical protein
MVSGRAFGTFGGGDRQPQGNPQDRPVTLTARGLRGELLRVGRYRRREDAERDAAAWIARGDVGEVSCVGGEAAPCVACGAYAPEHEPGCVAGPEEVVEHG